LQVIAEAQRRGGLAAIVDTEHALDVQYAQRLGVDLDNLLLSQPEFGEQALEIVETLVRSGAIDVIVIDSVAALTPRVEIEGDMGDAQMGSQARLMSQGMRKLQAAIGRSNAAVIFTNQLRSKIGVIYGNPETTTGGNALKYYASLRIDIRRKDVIKEGQEIVGNRVRAKIVKNKVAPPFRECEFDIMYNEGISKLGDMIDLGVEHGLITRSGSWFSFKEERVQGRDGLRKLLQDSPELLVQLEQEVKEKLGIAGK
ncbi:MAG: recombinase RecA, partial [Candidatus Kapabacteria bacterium]|nr:recombinase RecA [Candidatus Kapabacteria bacterium]